VREQLARSEKTVAELEHSLADRDDTINSSRLAANSTEQSASNILKEFEAFRENWNDERLAMERQLTEERNRCHALEEQLSLAKVSAAGDSTIRDERDRLARDLELERHRVQQLETELQTVSALSENPSAKAGPETATQPNDDLQLRLQHALNDNERLRSLIRGLGITV
jgi:hypothetical protein